MTRDQLIDRAIRERRISASQRDEYLRLYEAQPAVIENLLTAGLGDGGLMPGLAAAHETLNGEPAYDPAWLNERERAALAARQAPPAAAPAPAAPSPALPATHQRPPLAPAASAAIPVAEPADGYDESWLSGKSGLASERSRPARTSPGQ